MRTVAIVQARMGSSRLPGKVLAPIGDHPLLSYVVRRVQLAKLVDRVIVATPATKADAQIHNWCLLSAVDVLAGAERDVLGRYLAVAEHARADRIVRITADCPLIDPDVIDATIEACEGKPWASNIHPARTWPDGLDVEVMTIETLRALDVYTSDLSDREHVTPLLYRGGEYHKKVILPAVGGSLAAPVPLGDLQWTVDTQEDLDWVCQVYSRLPWHASWQQVLFSGIEHRRAA